MRFLKKNYGWLVVVILASLPLIPLLSILNDNDTTRDSIASMLYHISGEFAIRWMTAVLTLTPFFILFGITNLYVRQAMGIATAVWSFIHFILFVWIDGFLETFTQVNYLLGFVAVLMLIPLFFTSSRNAMKRFKKNWKKLQSLAYVIAALSLLHIVILDKTWRIYAIIVGIGFLIRIPIIKRSFISFRESVHNTKTSN